MSDITTFSTYNWEFMPVVILFFFSCMLVMLLFIANFIADIFHFTSKNYEERLSAYECGFEAFDDARMQFDVRYYLVAILFLIFDIEILFILPWAINLSFLSSFGFWNMFFFITILTLGFFYEFFLNALEWEAL